jgi:hypothetical protein
VTTWLNTPIQMQFRVIDGLSVRFAQSQDRGGPARAAASFAIGGDLPILRLEYVRRITGCWRSWRGCSSPHPWPAERIT